MKLSEIISAFESAVPIDYQEDYDNSGLVTGELNMDIKGALLCIDVTMDIVEEAIQSQLNMIISHHPVIFKPIRRITGTNYTEKIILAAIRNNIAIYSAHTNIDNIFEGVNLIICRKLGIENSRILDPHKNSLKKLVTYVPEDYADAVRFALFESGAGNIGKYNNCSFNSE